MIASHFAAAAVAAALAAGAAWHVQSLRYEARIAAREQEIAQAAQAAQAAARKREQELQRHADQIARESARRQQLLADRVATAAVAARSLRGDIARLNSGPAPADPAAARYADAAARARELLGACAEEYRGVAGAADGLRDQVTGLQDYARSVAGR